ncbi:MAG: hypothetical protein ABIJ27_08305 [Candidatus Omnitrophota bacterium]
MKSLHTEYKKKKNAIRARLKSFKRVFAQGDEEILAELFFCIMTPQSKALSCVRIPLAEIDLLFWSRQTGVIFK